ncbi:sigma factor-like helix-turn-helix DNA-binding protein [Paractinoplanes brasiliensis]|uniref:RNA polymerase sigma-70 factor (ECF subfamily) n=1 Tax=Paractinoplanes brasiliensis TaxID=52695 RepID=A0A4R6JPB1_9ACTN|nr:sigma factor-like helix-turn-helix DNA-binding protein [Actinoplanes brasiliensis]TDO38353.1 RNA polymerase sigma-70 factor (ECF subfamily) [Actinoplanes brasiliensis]GID26870.1 DNA-directed RNA polymerase sigma-70 factor [Actinoplanes brasiliensis]
MSRRDRTAGEVLVRRLFAEHGAALLAYATRLSGDRARAEEIVRETLLRAWSAGAALSEDRGAVRAHLFPIVRAVATEQGVPGVPAGPMEMLVAVGALPPEQREALNQLYFQGRDVKEAAASLGLEAETVKSRSYQALRRLREALRAAEPTGVS